MFEDRVAKNGRLFLVSMFKILYQYLFKLTINKCEFDVFYAGSSKCCTNFVDVGTSISFKSLTFKQVFGHRLWTIAGIWPRTLTS